MAAVAHYKGVEVESVLEDRCVGCILGAMSGDVLGAALEGHSIPEARKQFGILRDFVPCLHMGASFQMRYGMYTDDTNSTLALAASLVEKQALDPEYTAKKYSEFYFTADPKRGYPFSAIAIMKAISEGADYRTTGTVSFKDGSFANGGAMRIAPIPLAFRNATNDELYEAVRWAIISTHVHPEGIDGAFVEAKAIQIALNLKSPDDLKPEQFLKELRDIARTKGMKGNIEKVIKRFAKHKKGETVDELELVMAIGSKFQIKAIEAVPCALWAVATHWNEPEEAIICAVNLAGDADTVGLLAGAIAGALHGTSWIPDRWFDNLENKEKGRDYAIALAKGLAKLDLRTVSLNKSSSRS